MNESREYKLIEGVFSPLEVEKLLGAMVKSKMDFHSLQLHSEVELSGKPAASEERLKQLKALDAELKTFFVQAKESGKNFKISGRIEVTPVD